MGYMGMVKNYIEVAKQKSTKLIDKSSFSEKGRNFLKDKLAYSVRIKFKRTSDESLCIGQSKIGGDPDLPREWEWPSFYNVDKKRTIPLYFVGQLNLSELAIWDYEQRLPSQGWIYFFDDEYLEDHRFFALHFDGSVDELTRRTVSDDSNVRFRKDDWDRLDRYDPCQLSYWAEWMLPCGGAPDELYDIETMSLADVTDHYYNLMHDIESLCPFPSQNRLFGYPYMEEEVDNWPLFLQIDSDHETDMYWGDAGCIQYRTIKSGWKNGFPDNFHECVTRSIFST